MLSQRFSKFDPHQTSLLACTRPGHPGQFSSRHHECDSRSPDRNFNSTAHSLWVEHQINLASKLVRDEIAYEIGAIAGLDLGFHRRAVALLPDYRQTGPISVRLTIPIHPYVAAGIDSV